MERIVLYQGMSEKSFRTPAFPGSCDFTPDSGSIAGMMQRASLVIPHILGTNAPYYALQGITGKHIMPFRVQPESIFQICSR